MVAAMLTFKVLATYGEKEMMRFSVRAVDAADALKTAREWVIFRDPFLGSLLTLHVGSEGTP